jgi:hypothetical protein
MSFIILIIAASLRWSNRKDRARRERMAAYAARVIEQQGRFRFLY